jgi:putative aldouronate transport system substrate-binding protein
MFITYLFPEDPKNKWERFKKWNASAVKSPILGFTFDPSPVKTEMSAISNATDEYGRGLLSGAYDPNKYLPLLIEKMKDAGMEKVLSEMQKQVDEWWTINHKE